LSTGSTGFGFGFGFGLGLGVSSDLGGSGFSLSSAVIS